MKSQFLNNFQQAIHGKEHIIWDWNGTLLDDVGHAVLVMNTLLKEHDLQLIDREYYRSIFKFPVLNYYERLGFDFKKESFESLCHKFVGIIEGLLDRNDDMSKSIQKMMIKNEDSKR